MSSKLHRIGRWALTTIGVFILWALVGRLMVFAFPEPYIEDQYGDVFFAALIVGGPVLILTRAYRLPFISAVLAFEMGSAYLAVSVAEEASMPPMTQAVIGIVTCLAIGQVARLQLLTESPFRRIAIVAAILTVALALMALVGAIAMCVVGAFGFPILIARNAFMIRRADAQGSDAQGEFLARFMPISMMLYGLSVLWLFEAAASGVNEVVDLLSLGLSVGWTYYCVALAQVGIERLQQPRANAPEL